MGIEIKRAKREKGKKKKKNTCFQRVSRPLLRGNNSGYYVCSNVCRNWDEDGFEKDERLLRLIFISLRRGEMER